MHGWMTCHTCRCTAGQADDIRVTRVSTPYIPPLNEVNEVQGFNSSLVINLLVVRNFEGIGRRRRIELIDSSPGCILILGSSRKII